jgi:fatty-acyl-CoA synthase
MYTSGTTDRPKGVMHSYSNFYWKSADHIALLGLTNETRLLIAGPMYHVGAFDLPGVAVLWTGGVLVILREFTAQLALTAIQQEKVTGVWFVPVMTTMILTFPERHAYDVSSLRWAVGGGERTPESRIREFSNYFTQARYIDAYGLTETSSGDTFMVAGREIEKIGSTGIALPTLDVSIRDESGNVLPTDAEGEICLRGPKVTKGYWRDPQKTASAFFGDWFRTGDIGRLDAERFLYLTDRKKDMIISGGENIASSEVERVILTLPEVLETAVIGMPDPRWGERPVAVVVLNAGAMMEAELVLTHCRSNLASFKVPKLVIFVEALPRNPSGKILKRVLRDGLAATTEV